MVSEQLEEFVIPILPVTEEIPPKPKLVEQPAKEVKKKEEKKVYRANIEFEANKSSGDQIVLSQAEELVAHLLNNNFSAPPPAVSDTSPVSFSISQRTDDLIGSLIHSKSNSQSASSTESTPPPPGPYFCQFFL